MTLLDYQDAEENGSEYAYRVDMTHALEWTSETNEVLFSKVLINWDVLTVYVINLVDQ